MIGMSASWAPCLSGELLPYLANCETVVGLFLGVTDIARL